MSAQDVHGAANVPESVVIPRKRAERAVRGVSDRVKWLFVLPGVFWILAFTIFPLLYALRLSLHNAIIGRPERFIGLGNYARMLSDYRLWAALQVTVQFVVVSVFSTVVLGLLLALLFNRKMKGVQFFRALFTTPLFAPPIALGYLGLTLFYEDGGPVNNFLQVLGFGRVPWLSEGFWAFMAIVLMDIWQWTPFAFIVLLAGLQSLPEEIYEAAALDTSSAFQTFRYITLPMIAPVLGTVTILRMVEAFKVIDIPYSLTSGGPGIATRTYSFYTYTQGLRNSDLGYGTAMAFGLLVIILIISTFFFMRARHIYE